MTSEHANEYHRAALRSRLVSRLTGLSSAQLQYWHKTSLQTASTRAGMRGTPRLYSWVDYQRLRVIAKLVEAGVPTLRIRRAVDYLDQIEPAWHRLSLERYKGAVPPRTGAGLVHVAANFATAAVLADAAGQTVYRLSCADDDDAALESAVRCVLAEMKQEGPLFKLNRFDDVVQMRPEVNVGLPTLRGSRLETAFVARLAKLSSFDEVAALYGLEANVVARAVEFEEAA